AGSVPRATITRPGTRRAASDTRAYIPGRISHSVFGTVTVTFAVRVDWSTIGLLVSIVPMNVVSGNAANEIVAFRPGARYAISPSSTWTSTLIGSRSTTVISSSETRTHCPGTTLIEAIRPGNGGCTRVRARRSSASRSDTRA